MLAYDGVDANAGLLGLLVIIALGVAMVFLYRSMTKQLRKVPASFDEPPVDGPRDAEEPDPRS